MIVNTVKDFFKKLATYERCPRLLALSFCVGTYIAFSPFLFCHTIMVFIFCLIFKLNIPVTFAASAGINNPWTAVPIYLLDYGFGRWFLYKLLNLTPLTNPHLFNSLEQFWLQYVSTSKPCMWSFLIGGNLLGIACALLLYPFIKSLFSYFLQNQAQRITTESST